jgi:hypothetical protein
MATKKGTAKSTTKSTSETRPEDYIPQQGNKATLTLADFTDDNLFGELRRRGYHGTLQYSKTINV